MEFATLNEAYDFYYRYGKYNGFAVRKGDSRVRGSEGCNHHSQTVIFGAALVSDEMTETYKWVLTCFLECMEGKQPKAVVTNGDGAMREAIKQIFPDANHRLCTWHLNKNAGENVKNGNNFLDGFSKAMYSNFKIDEFEEYWSQMIKENGVQGHPWIVKTYENRSLWAIAYLRDNFFGHPVLSTQLPVIESHAGKIYTAKLFKEVRHEILKAGELIVRDKSEVGGRKTYRLTKFSKDGYERSVVYDGSTFKCSCKRFESRGIPCSHIFYVMKEEHVDRIPSNLVLTRWTKDAKIQFLNSSNCNDNVDLNMIAEACFGSYCMVLTEFCKEASKKDGVYAQIMEDLMQLKKSIAVKMMMQSVHKSAVQMPKIQLLIRRDVRVHNKQQNKRQNQMSICTRCRFLILKAKLLRKGKEKQLAMVKEVCKTKLRIRRDTMLLMTIGVVPVKTEPFDAIWISSDDEGDNVAKGFAKRVSRRVDKKADNNGAKRVDKTVDNNGANRVDKTAVQNVAPKVVRVRKEKVEWITPVTKAMQKLRKKQTLHIPSWVVKHALLEKTEIYLRSAQTKRTYECVILNPGRSLQRYIGDGWYDYVDLHKPKVGDILHFSMNPPYNLIVVSLIR
ncbi:unnamed protein product [Trifolium pratense]|uniref:Uncharacterized protein n=1 Tax=Trifolium pratense TaxID=57577 RepID=A0ACB0L646_TRIPR|nr:unnamed protein product [Trifolium pratense]